jgi:hypothetical protein
VGDIFRQNNETQEIFRNFNPATMMGIKYAAFSTTSTPPVAESKSPMVELYGGTPHSVYVVETTGQSSVSYQRLNQVTTELRSGRRFARFAYNDGPTINWSTWTEVPTLSYSPAVMTIIVDGENGDDATANGTEARAYRTVQAALNAIPKMLHASVTIRIKAGTYTPEAGKRFTFGGVNAGSGITITSFSGNNDVELTGNTTNGSEILYISDITGQISIEKIDLNGGPDGTMAGCGIFLDRCPFSKINYCHIRNMRNAAYWSREGACIVALNSNVSVGANEFSNAYIGIYARPGSSVISDNNTSDSVNIGLKTSAGIIRKIGTQPAETVANEQISNAGQII